MKVITFVSLKLPEDNRMLRIGFGKNKGLWFFRLDLWWKGYRIAW